MNQIVQKYRVLHVDESFKIPVSDADNFLNLFSSSFSIDIQGGSNKVSCCTVITAYFFWATLYIFGKNFREDAISSILCEAVDRKTNRHTNKPRILHNLLGAANDQLLWNP